MGAVFAKKTDFTGRGKADVLIKRARVCDGTGQPWFPADIAVKAGRITAVGAALDIDARRVLDARGLVVAPGFIDVHTHAAGILNQPAAVNFIRQGVTTVVSGNCGSSDHPVRAHLDAVEQAAPAVNYAMLAGHGTLRRQAMGMAARRPLRKELARMRRLAGQAMREGAVGLSSGLFYVPGAWADVRELADVCRVIADWGGIYATHKRSAGGQVFAAVAEAAEIGRRGGVPVQISHLKVLHRRTRTKDDRMEKLIAYIGRYREEGVDIAWDVHPYPATCTSLSAVVIPDWVSEGGRLVERLRDAAVRRSIRREVGGKIAWIGGADRIQVISSACAGMHLAQIARARQADPVVAAMDLVAENNPRCIFHALRESDVDLAVTSDPGMIASDGGVIDPRSTRPVHPRNYGTFPRVIGEYVRERGLLTLETAIRKMTLMPARRFRLRNRGMVAVGMQADLVIFDPLRMGSRADFDHPHRFPEGLRWVLVNGGLAWGPRVADRGRWGQVVRG